MHEFSIAGSLLERVEAEARARRATAVHAVHVRIGELSGADAEAVAVAYDILRERTSCARAPLHVEAVPARWVCGTCGAELGGGGGATLHCGSCRQPARLAQGDEIVLVRIELEVEHV